MKWMRNAPRFDYFGKVTWDYFGEKTGSKTGYLGDISNSGCLLKTNEWIDQRRWVRLIVEDQPGGAVPAAAECCRHFLSYSRLP